MSTDHSDITLEIYRGYALNELDRWDKVMHPDVAAISRTSRRSAVS